MDNAQIEQQLEDLEGRLERLRSLYEQYFMGLEKLEPTVLRKEVDRKMWELRREQIRNTGLRFKFQMLVQRYNTYQQYWTRVVREIENGTYRRDILKVAQRFGEKDALTILGKKRAEQYKRLAKNQQDRRTKRNELFGNEPSAAAPPIEEEIALDNDDFELVDELDEEDATTPPRGVPAVRAADANPAPQAPPAPPAPPPSPRDAGPPARSARPSPDTKPARSEDRREPDMEAMLHLATVGVKDWSARPQPPPSAPPEPAQGAPSLARPAVSAAPTTGFGEISIATSPDPAANVSVPPPRSSSPGVTSAASKSRVAELAAQMRAKKEAAKPKVDALDLDSLLGPDSAETKPTSAPSKPIFRPTSSPTPTASTTPLPKPPPAQPTAQPTTSASTTPLPKPPPAQPAQPAQPRPSTSPFPRPASTTSLPGAAPAPKVTSPPIAPAAAPAPAPKPAVSAPPAARKEDLTEQKMREIYAKYVGAKRAANESTAGITYDKLASSLRAQAEKIRTTHPTRSVDFEIVTKDGKTALRPIVK